MSYISKKDREAITATENDLFFYSASNAFDIKFLEIEEPTSEPRYVAHRSLSQNPFVGGETKRILGAPYLIDSILFAAQQRIKGTRNEYPFDARVGGLARHASIDFSLIICLYSLSALSHCLCVAIPIEASGLGEEG